MSVSGTLKLKFGKPAVSFDNDDDDSKAGDDVAKHVQKTLVSSRVRIDKNRTLGGGNTNSSSSSDDSNDDDTGEQTSPPLPPPQSSSGKRNKPYSRPQEKEESRHRKGNVVTIKGFNKNKIPKPDGKVDSYYDGDEPFGPEWIKKVIYDRLSKFQQDKFIKFIILVASHLGKSSSSLSDNTDESALVNKIGDFSEVIRTNQDIASRNESTKKTKTSTGVGAKKKSKTKPAQPESSSSDDTSEDETTSDDDVNLKRGKEKNGNVASGKNPKTAKKKPRVLPEKYNHKQLLQWLLEQGDSATATDLEIVTRLVSHAGSEDLRWLEFPAIGGKQSISEVLLGSIRFCLFKVNKKLSARYKVDEDTLIDNYPELFSWLVAKKIELATRTRFMTPEDRAVLEREYQDAMTDLVYEIQGEDTVETRAILHNRSLIEQFSMPGFQYTNRKSVSACERWMLS